MADNRVQYGFRFARGIDGGRNLPQVEERWIATGTNFAVNGGAATPKLQAGDLVKQIADGSVNLADGTENTTQAPYGVVVGVVQYWDAVAGRLVKGSAVPSGVAWGTNWERRTRVLVIPVSAAIWEVDSDDIVNQTVAQYGALIGSNMDHRNWGAAGEDSIKPRLDVSTTNTTATLVWRVMGISQSVDNQDYTGQFVKMLVRANVGNIPTLNNTGV